MCLGFFLGREGSGGFYFYSLVYNCKSGIISHELCIDSNPSLFSELIKCKSCLKHHVHRNINIFSMFVSKCVSVREGNIYKWNVSVEQGLANVL